MNLASVRKNPAFYFLLALLVLWMPLLWRITRPFVTSILLAVVLSVVVYPFYERSLRSLKRPGLASGLTTLLSLTAIAALLTLVGMVLGAEVSAGYQRLDQMSSREGGWSAFATHIMDRSIEFVAAKTSMDEASLRAQIDEGLRRGAAMFLGLLRSMLAAITSGLVNFIFASIFLYFFLCHGPRWVEQIESILPLEPRATRHLMNTLKDSIIANVNGVLVVALSQAVLLFIGFFAAGIGGALLWSLIGGMASVIPIVGATIVWVPCVVWLLVQAQWLKAILLAVWCAVVVGSSDNVLRPLVVGGRVQQHPVLIGLAMMGGAQAFGAAGVLIGPVILSFFFAVLKELALVAGAGTVDASSESTDSAAEPEIPAPVLPSPASDPDGEAS